VTTGLSATLRGEAHRPGENPAAATVTLGDAGLTVSVGGGAPWSAGYRDVAAVGVDGGTVTLDLGDATATGRWVLERFGTMTGRLARGLRDGRLRQRLADALVQLDPEAEIDLVEYEAPGEAGIAQLVYHDRGVVVAPLDERVPWHRVRRRDIGTVTVEPAVGGVAVTGAGRSLPLVADGPSLRLLRLGPLATAHHDRWAGLRDGAAADATAIVGGLVPDAPFALRSTASSLLVDGRPVAAGALGAGWNVLEAATLGIPPFDASYRVLQAIGGGDAAPRWLACAPEQAGAPQSPRVWFFVGLPGNLVAMELVSEGAHATYVFRVVPRSAWTGTLPAGATDDAVADVSEALVDARFLREPIALPAAQLALPAALGYRLALAALPSLAAARARFVARLVHRDPASWEAALRDLVAWHGTATDDAAEWPGRAGQEAQVDEAAASGG
jgi:hypothetical protein